MFDIFRTTNMTNSYVEKINVRESSENNTFVRIEGR